VTGAGRGIGRAVAIGLASAGSAVGLVARSHDELAETARHVADTVTPRTISGLDEPATPRSRPDGPSHGWWRGVLVPWPRQLPSLRSPSWPE
jgi:NAD(P)-dependent dehydrogenase (short-subunit alcohol dehydrogenase family)